MQWFRVSDIFPHPPCIGRGVPEAPTPHIPKRLRPAQLFSASRSPTFVGFPMTRTRLCDSYCERAEDISLETRIIASCPLFFHSLIILFGRSRPFRWRQLCFLIGRLRKILVTLLGQEAIELSLMEIEKNMDAFYP